MEIKQVIFYMGILTQFVSCAFLSERSSESGYQKYSEGEIKSIDSEALLNNEDLQMISNRQKLRLLERSIKTSKERELYSKILPLLNSDLEKIEFLNLPNSDAKQIWIAKKKYLVSISSTES